MDFFCYSQESNICKVLTANMNLGELKELSLICKPAKHVCMINMICMLLKYHAWKNIFIKSYVLTKVWSVSMIEVIIY